MRGSAALQMVIHRYLAPCMRFCFFIVLLSFIVSGSYGQVKEPVSIVRDSVAKPALAAKVFIRHIDIVGNKLTKREIILREMNVRPGDMVAADSLEALMDLNRKRLYNMTLFTDVAIYMDTLSLSEVKWTIAVHEQWYIMPELTLKLADRNFNVWWDEQHHDIRRANLGVVLKHRNFRGNMESLSATVQIGYTQKFGMEYFKPYIDKNQQHGIGASFFVSKNEETYYTTDSNKLRFIKIPGKYIIRQFEAAAIYVFRPKYANKHLLEIRYLDHEINDTLIKLNPDYFEKGSTTLKALQLTYRFEQNRVDNWNYPLQGFKAVGYLSALGGWEGIRFQAYGLLEAGYFYKLQRKWYASNIFRGRLTLPEDQPYKYRYAMGSGSEYVRGYEYYVIDGSQYGILRNNLKYELLNVRIRKIPIRYLPVIPIRIYPKIFADAGYAYYRYPGNSFLNNRLLYSGGFGIDVITAYDLKFRLEYTWNHLGQKGLFLHINSE